MKFLDASILGTLDECPRKCQLRYVLHKVPREEGLAKEFGSSAHAGRNEWYESGDVEKAVGLVKKLWEPYEGKDPDGLYTAGKLEEVVRAYVNQFGSEPWKHKKGEQLLEFEMFGQSLVGLVDGTGEYLEEAAFQEFKTSKYPGMFCSRPNLQLTTYGVGLSMLAGHTVKRAILTIAGLYKTSVGGVLAARKKADPPRSIFLREVIDFEEWDYEEWKRDLYCKMDEIERYEKEGYWPKRPKSCSLYGRCIYQPICVSPEYLRGMLLESNFVTRVWDPREERR